MRMLEGEAKETGASSAAETAIHPTRRHMRYDHPSVGRLRRSRRDAERSKQGEEREERAFSLSFWSDGVDATEDDGKRRERERGTGAVVAAALSSNYGHSLLPAMGGSASTRHWQWCSRRRYRRRQPVLRPPASQLSHRTEQPRAAHREESERKKERKRGKESLIKIPALERRRQ